MARKFKGPSFDPNLLLAKTGRGRTKLEYRSEEVVFSQGDAADSIFYILRGKIKIVVTSKQGREAVVALLGEGDFFGEGCLIAQPLRLATRRFNDRRYCHARRKGGDAPPPSRRARFCRGVHGSPVDPQQSR